MSEARDELRELLDSLPDDQVDAVLADVRRRTQPKPHSDRPWPPSWFGAIDRDDLPTDIARNHDKYLAESGFGTYR